MRPSARWWPESSAAKGGKIGHDLRDARFLFEAAGFSPRFTAPNWIDAQLASFLLDPTGHLPHGLNDVARAYLARALHPLPGAKGRQRASLERASEEERARYAAERAEALHDLMPVLAERLAESDQRRIHDELSLPLAGILSRMQRDGIRVDGDALASLGVEFRARRDAVEAEVFALAGREFNLASPKQLGVLLFEEMGLPVQKRTKTGYSTNAEVLEALAPAHPIAGHILRYRALAKLINTYTRVLQEAIQPETGRVHCTFQQTVSASGRLITTEPDLQRTPIRTDDGRRIREAFLPAEGWELVSADWSQIELRLLAHMSGDEALLDAFRERVDVHGRTAAEIFGVAPEAVDARQRNVGKTVNFATIYGQGATALGRSLGVQRKEAKAYIERYFEIYAGVRAWADEQIARAHERGFVETMVGRRRQVPELSSGHFQTRAYGERIAVNTPIQGSAADLCKLAMLKIRPFDRRTRFAGADAPSDS